MRSPSPAEKPSNPDPSLADVPEGHVVVGAVDLLVAGWVQAVTGDDVNTVSGQDLTVGVLVAGAGVEAGVRQFKALNQQPTLHVEGAVVIAVRDLLCFLCPTESLLLAL